MKLAQIEHDRCGEIEAKTYVWVEDAMHDDELEALLKLAKESYLKAEDAFKSDPDAPPAPNWQNKYSFCPDKTVREAEALFQERVQARKDWEQKRDAARRPFSEHLEVVANGRVKLFYDGEFPLRATVSWGHRHGTTIAMGATNPTNKDLNAYQLNEGNPNYTPYQVEAK